MFSQGVPLDNLLNVPLPKNIPETDVFAKLKPGDILQGTILKNNPSEGAATARFGGHEVRLPKAPNLVPGQSISAEVLKVSNKLLLKLIDPAARDGIVKGMAIPSPYPSKTGGGKAVTLVLNPPENLNSGNILSVAKPGDIITGKVIKTLGQNQSIIKFGNVETFATSSQAFSTGQTVTARMERNLPQVSLKILQTSSPEGDRVKLPGDHSVSQKQAPYQEITIKFPPNQVKNVLGQVPLKDGQLTDVKVIQLTSTNKAILDIAGKLIEVPVPKGLEVGKSLTMAVESQPPELVLKSVRPDPGLNVEKAAGFIREFLPTKEPIEKTLVQLSKLLSEEQMPQALKSDRTLTQGVRQSLADVVLASPNKPSEALLQKAFNLSGQSYEAKIKSALENGISPEVIKNRILKGDLKGELLKLGEAIEEKINTLMGNAKKGAAPLPPKTAGLPAQNYEAKPKPALEKGSAPEVIRDQVLKGGVLKSREAADVKPAAQTGDTKEIPAQVRELQTLGNSIRSTVNQIELSQVMNAVNQREDGSVFFQVPYISDDGKMKTVDVFVKRNGTGKDGRDEKDDCNVTLLLDMAFLGPLRADVNIRPGSVHAKLTCRDEAVSQFIEGSLPALESRLKESGYAAQLECAVSKEEKVTPQHAISEKAPINGLGILDVKV